MPKKGGYNLKATPKFRKCVYSVRVRAPSFTVSVTKHPTYAEAVEQALKEVHTFPGRLIVVNRHSRYWGRMFCDGVHYFAWLNGELVHSPRRLETDTDPSWQRLKELRRGLRGY